VRSVDKEPSSHPELRDEERKVENDRKFSVVPRPVQEKQGIEDKKRSGNEGSPSQVSGKDSPGDDAKTQNSQVHTAENWSRKSFHFALESRINTARCLRLGNLLWAKTWPYLFKRSMK